MPLLPLLSVETAFAWFPAGSWLTSRLFFLQTVHCANLHAEHAFACIAPHPGAGRLSFLPKIFLPPLQKPSDSGGPGASSAGRNGTAGTLPGMFPLPGFHAVGDGLTR